MLVLIVTLFSFDAARAQEAMKKGDLKKIYKMMVGHFTSEEQSKADSSYFNIHLNMVPIMKKSKNGYWLYVEQATATALNKPYKKYEKNFKGTTPGKECLSSLRGASYATSEVTVTSDRLLSWDRGWSKEDKQVWGAEKGGYVFVKVKG